MTLPRKKKLHFRPNSACFFSYFSLNSSFQPLVKIFTPPTGLQIFFFILVRVITLQESGELRWINRESEAEWSKVNRSFSLSRRKKINWKPSRGRSQESEMLQKTKFWTICPSRGSLWPMSYLPKRFTHLCRALYGDAILVYRFGAPIWVLT